MRTPQNTQKYLLNIKDALETLETLMKSYWAEKALEPSEMFQNYIRTNDKAWDHVRRPLNVRQPLRTFINVLKALKTHKMPQNASEHPQNFIECL